MKNYPITSKLCQSFPPVINANTRILVIGSMPGDASLQAQQYYAHPHNQFWKLIFELFEYGRAPRNYQDKLNTLLTHQIGLWDALASCQRKGSLDSAIVIPQPNDFSCLFRQFAKVDTLLFNGQAAATYFRRFCQQAAKGKTLLTLPSTSPAHATRSFEQKKQCWQAAFEQALKFPFAHPHELL